MKNVVIGIAAFSAGALLVLGSFVDFGLENFGPGKSGQTFSSVCGAFIALGGVLYIVDHLRTSKSED